MCLSEIPLDLQDTQLSPKATGPGPTCHLLFALISTPALHVLQAAMPSLGFVSCTPCVTTAVQLSLQVPLGTILTTLSSWHQLQASPRRPTWLVQHEEQRHYENVLQSHKKRGLAEISWPVAGSPIIYSCSGTPSLQASSDSWPQHCCSKGCASSLLHAIRCEVSSNF